MGKLKSEHHRLSNKNIEEMTADCSQCGTVRIYYKNHKNIYVCGKKRAEDDAKRRKRTGSSKWVSILGEARYEDVVKELWDTQGGICPICKDDLSSVIPHLDHNHQTNRVRGLLCGRCNSGLGFFRDNPVALSNAIEYLNLPHNSNTPIMRAI